MEGAELTEMATSPPQLHVVTSEADDLVTGAKDLIDMLEIAKVESGELIGGLLIFMIVYKPTFIAKSY